MTGWTDIEGEVDLECLVCEESVQISVVSPLSLEMAQDWYDNHPQGCEGGQR